MAVDKAYMVNLSPDFTSVADTRVEFLRPIMEAQVSKQVFGAQFDYAVALLIAHVITIGNNGGAGPVTSKRAGDLQISYGAVSSSDSELGLSSWGIEFKRLRRQNVLPVLSV